MPSIVTLMRQLIVFWRNGRNSGHGSDNRGGSKNSNLVLENHEDEVLD